MDDYCPDGYKVGKNLGMAKEWYMKSTKRTDYTDVALPAKIKLSIIESMK